MLIFGLPESVFEQKMSINEFVNFGEKHCAKKLSKLKLCF